MKLFAKRWLNIVRSVFSWPRSQQPLSSRRRPTQLSFEQLEDRLTPSGNIITVAGTGSASYNGDNIPATSAMLNQPNGVAVDGSGNVFISDWHNSRIREVNSPPLQNTRTRVVTSSGGSMSRITAQT